MLSSTITLRTRSRHHPPCGRKPTQQIISSAIITALTTDSPAVFLFICKYFTLINTDINCFELPQSHYNLIINKLFIYRYFHLDGHRFNLKLIYIILLPKISMRQSPVLPVNPEHRYQVSIMSPALLTKTNITEPCALNPEEPRTHRCLSEAYGTKQALLYTVWHSIILHSFFLTTTLFSAAVFS